MTTTSIHTVVNPATEQPVVDVPLADEAATDAAVAAAHEAFQSWRGVAPGGAASGAGEEAKDTRGDRPPRIRPVVCLFLFRRGFGRQL